MSNLKNAQLMKQACLINNKWKTAKSGKTIDVYNPFSGELLGNVPNLSAKEVEKAIAHAEQAQVEWAKLTAEKRAQILQRWADLIDEHQEDLAIIMTLEQGKPLKESRGEIAYANSFIRWFAEEGKRIYGDIIPSLNTNLRYSVLKQPIGVCAAITPWNFPSAMITRKVAPALAAGCTMIVRPASQTPFSALALGELAIQAGLPAGVLQIVTGSADVVGAVLTQDERIRKLSFTGSTKIGRQLMQQCSSTIKKLSMELGGNAPFIVFEDADIDKAVDGLIASKYRNAGQTCICANRIYLHENIQDKFIKRYSKKVKALQVGNGLDENTDIGPLINQSAVEKVQQLLDDAVSKGAKIILGGKTHKAGALCFQPTIIHGLTDDMHIAHEEIFGPVTAIFSFTHEQEVLEHANHSIYGLAAYFYTQDLARSWRVTERLDYGMIGQNTGLISNAVTPFGGVKQSGFGREGSKYGIDEYISIKYWCLDIAE
ncbi:NAD-dependent succinate-semialdehyde dehydrogenase [Moraxella sp. ZY210820]|uniref:NAD-dependent succinate-semialdehyde dehydrogenase n=1 Tax=unclassified Moraxella TaxID=2685852 RepID=UPI00272FD197|nr:NAD-dependent succinate-semialdehyde dehydrogenase [Moraxella sp. ZY210820]WLF83840.1 NAD-dependent succinate-semialdehyde dehydrogenase [Moraxella sp. ZY210820]